jgi:AraC-like DNA-binding protein
MIRVVIFYDRQDGGVEALLEAITTKTQHVNHDVMVTLRYIPERTQQTSLPSMKAQSNSAVLDFRKGVEDKNPMAHPKPGLPSLLHLPQQRRLTVPPASQWGSERLTGSQLRRVHTYLQETLSQAVTLRTLAAVVHLSPFHFARAFKNTTGLPPHRYRMQLRIQQAKALLKETPDNVTDIAYACGFNSSQHLARVFRRVVGMTPTAFRRFHYQQPLKAKLPE